MEHRLLRAIQKALGWSDASPIGKGFARGHMEDLRLCERLLTPSKLLDLVMRRSVEPPQLRCFQDGMELHPHDYLSIIVNRRRQNVRLADMRSLATLSGAGFTLVLDALDTFDPTMEIACRALQWWSHELVQVNAYLTTQQTAGFPLHWDDHDVVVVHLAGEKTWEVRSYSRSVPMYRDAASNLTPSERVVWRGTMQTGDVMHIPRGYWHQATRDNCGEDFSLHVTFGFVKRTGVDWLAWLADQAREHELFRHDLLRWETPEERAEQERILTVAARELLESLVPSVFLQWREQVQPPGRHVALPDLGDLSTVVCLAEFAPHLEECGDEIVVCAAGRRVRLKARALPALRLLLSGHPVPVDQASSQTGLNVRQLADVLIEEGICVQATPELLSGYTDLVTDVGC